VPVALRCASAGAWHNWHSGTRRDSLRPRAYRVSAVLCRVEHNGTSGAGLVAQRGSQRPAMAIPLSWHRLGPRDMSLEAKRSRHVAVAIPEVRISCGIAVSPRQESPQPQQPDLARR
jgi:hypothetical protein